MYFFWGKTIEFSNIIILQTEQMLLSYYKYTINCHQMVLRHVKYFIRCMGGNMISELSGGPCSDSGFRLPSLGVRFLTLPVNKVDMLQASSQNYHCTCIRKLQKLIIETQELGNVD